MRQFDRRRFLRVFAVVGIGGLAGCEGAGDDGDPDDGTDGDAGGTASPTDAPGTDEGLFGDGGDRDDVPAGRLANDTGEQITFDVTVRAEAGTDPRFDREIAVPAGERETIHGNLGHWGETYVVEVTAGGASATETVDYGAPSSDGGSTTLEIRRGGDGVTITYVLED